MHTNWKTPGRDFVNEDLATYSTRIGVITRVDDFNMKADVRILTGGGDRFEIDLTQAMCGPRSFWGGVPEVNSMVVIGYRRRSKHLQEAVILGYVPVGNRTGLRFDPFSSAGPSEIDPADLQTYEQLYGKPFRYKRLRLRSGDVGGMSSSGAELVLSKDVKMANRAGDLLELRDAERSLVTQTIHRVEGDGAIYRLSGPIRRGGLNLPPDIFLPDPTAPAPPPPGQAASAPITPPTPVTPPTPGSPRATPLVLKSSADPDRYFGGPHLEDPTVALADTSGTVLDRVNSGDFPAVALATGKQYYYVSNNESTNPEDATNGGSGRAFTEYRTEMRHDSDLTQEVREDIDGFSVDRPIIYIEQVYGTLVGNDPFTTAGLRQYGKILKPKLFDDFDQTNPATFRLENANRSPGDLDEANTAAGAYLFRMQPPVASSTAQFVVAVQKQGKVFLNIPGSNVEEDPNVQNISMEANLEGALKARIGAASPNQVSLHLTLDGGIHLDIGNDADGNSMNYVFRGGVKTEYRGAQNQDDVAKSDSIFGACEKYVRGAYRKIVNGSYSIKSTQLEQRATAINLTAITSISESSGSKTVTVAGLSQFTYGLLVTETIAAGGRLSTILAGADVANILAGAYTLNVAAGATSFANPAGAFAITVGTGAISATTAAGAVTVSTASGAVAISAGAGAVAITAGVAMNLTAATVISLISPQILLGGPPAVLGVCRGTPMYPPGAPSLDWFTGLPLQGSAMVRSI